VAKDLNHFKSAQKALVCMGNSAEDFFYGTVYAKFRVTDISYIFFVKGKLHFFGWVQESRIFKRTEIFKAIYFLCLDSATGGLG